MAEIKREKLLKYFEITRKALKKAKIVNDAPEVDWEAKAKDFLDMATRYFSDANHFYKKGDFIVVRGRKP